MLTAASKLADWDDDDPQAIQETSSRWDKVVILKHLFTLKELEVRLNTEILPSISFPDVLFIHRKTQQPSSTSKKTSEKNAPRWAMSPMSFCSTRNLMA